MTQNLKFSHYLLTLIRAETITGVTQIIWLQNMVTRVVWPA